MRLAITIVICVFALPAIAKEIGVTGRTYAIAERDALDELEERSRKVDWQKHLKAIKPGNYRPANLMVLPKARKTNTFLVDMAYTLENDIYNDKGKLLYPKGYTFNPLDFIKYQKTLVVIDGDDSDQLRWFQTSSLKNRLDVSLFITQGASLEIAKKIKRPVYYATSPLIARFQLKALPSIVKAKGKNMEVEEIAVQRGER